MPPAKTPAELPPEWRPLLDKTIAAQDGACLLCPEPATQLGIWEKSPGKEAIPYALCGGHGHPPSQETLVQVEDILADRGWDPLPAAPDGPLGYTRALEEQLALARYVDEARAKVADYERAQLVRFPFWAQLADGSRVDVIPASLAHAQPYFWSAALCDVLLKLAPTIPRRWTLVPETLVTPAGFNYFAAPLIPPGGVPAVTSFTWCRFDDELIFTTFLSYPERRAGFPSGLAVWRIGATLGELLDNAERNLREIDAQRPQQPTDRPLDERLARLVFRLRCYTAALVLLEQRILVTQRKPIPRAIRRRAARETKPPQLPSGIEVVVFRRALQDAVPAKLAGHAAVEWSCRWIVSGHWREQWYPSLGRHRPIWILPHVKGPEDKPMKSPTARIFAVVR